MSDSCVLRRRRLGFQIVWRIASWVLVLPFLVTLAGCAGSSDSEQVADATPTPPPTPPVEQPMAPMPDASTPMPDPNAPPQTDPAASNNPPSNPGVPASDPNSPNSNEPTPTTNTPVPNDPATTPPANPTTPAPENPGVPAANPDDPNKPTAPAPAPPPPKPAPPPTPKAPPGPFQNFPVSLDLPPMPAEGEPIRPQILGPVDAPSQAICVMHLLGGKTAVAADQRFEMIPESEELTNRFWEIWIVNREIEAMRRRVARLTIRENKVWFTWTDDAPSQANAPYLCNCVLRMQVGQGTHHVMLRKQHRVSPIVVKFDDEAEVAWDLPYPPDPTKMKVEFTLPTHSFPPYHYTGRATLTAKREATWIDFGNAKQDQGYRLRLDVELKDKLRITVTPHVQLAGWLKPERLSAAKLQHLDEQVKGGIEKIEQAMQSGGSSNSRTAAARNKTRAANELKEQKLNVQQVEAIKRWQTLIDGKSDIGVRVFYMADDRVCELFVAPATHRPPPPPPMPM